jgi:radical SAM protein with 4Fe4S-binding SPASM domain
VAESIKVSGMQYVGVSLDGLRANHDELRCMPGAFDRALNGIRSCTRLGIKTGIRFTINKLNRDDLPGVIDLLEQEGIPRFCMYHLVYSGRGKEITDMDTSPEEKLETMRFLVDRTMELYEKGVETELLTVDNHADGVYIYNYLLKKNPNRADEVMQLLKMHGGCSAGTKFANVDPLGNVHPCQFWQHVSLGNVRERRFSEIWNDKENDFLDALRRKAQLLKGRCGQCIYNTVCGGCRIRAEVVYGDTWAEDPACYLSDAEIGIDG